VDLGGEALTVEVSAHLRPGDLEDGAAASADRRRLDLGEGAAAIVDEDAERIPADGVRSQGEREELPGELDLDEDVRRARNLDEVEGADFDRARLEEGRDERRVGQARTAGGSSEAALALCSPGQEEQESGQDQQPREEAGSIGRRAVELEGGQGWILPLSAGRAGVHEVSRILQSLLAEARPSVPEPCEPGEWGSLLRAFVVESSVDAGRFSSIPSRRRGALSARGTPVGEKGGGEFFEGP
jgi:hypothetical protein